MIVSPAAAAEQGRRSIIDDLIQQGRQAIAEYDYEAARTALIPVPESPYKEALLGLLDLGLNRTS